MGRQQFSMTRSGTNIQDAYQSAIDDSTDEYGHQEGYSGKIQDCDGGLHDITHRYKKSQMSISQFIDTVMDDYEDDGVLAICTKTPIANTNQIKTKVNHKVVKGTRKWVLHYEVYTNDCEEKYIGRKLTKGDAVKLAREYTAKTGESTMVAMAKKLVDNAPIVASIMYKPSSTERRGTWIFFGEGRY